MVREKTIEREKVKEGEEWQVIEERGGGVWWMGGVGGGGGGREVRVRGGDEDMCV